MQPFHVNCETCRARLKVRNERAIGEIHACPRCGSMVYVAPPGGAGAAAAASATAAEPLPAQPAGDQGGADERFADVAIPQSPSPPTKSPAELPAIDTASAASTFGRAASAPPASALWSLAAAAMARPELVWSACGGAVLLTAGLIATMWLRGDAGVAEPPPQLAAVEPASTEPAEADAGREADDREPAAADQAPQVADSRGEALEPTDHELPPSDPLAEAQPVADEPAAPAPRPHDPAPVETSASDSNERDPPDAEQPRFASADESPAAAEEEPVDEPAQPVLQFDPLDFDPVALGLSPSGGLDDGTATASFAEDADSAEELAPLADDPVLDAKDAAPRPVEDPTIAVERGPIEQAAPPARDVGQRLALPLAALEMPAVSLSQFVEMVAEMAGVPITLDSAALSMAGASPRAEIPIRAANVTLEKLLRDTLAGQRLDFVEHDGQLVVVRTDADQRRSVNYEVRDLVPAGAADADSLGRLLQHCVAPETWQAAGGEGTIEVDGTTLRVEQTHGVHYQTLIFFERLRLARSLPMRSRYPAELLSVESPYGQLAGTLSQSTTFTFLPWTPLADVVRHWEEETGLMILVDWRALADVDLAPSSPVSCSAIDRTWDDALGEILEPLELAWLAVDGETIQITTQAAARAARTVEFYTVANSLREQFASDGALIDALGDELQEQADDDDGARSAPVHLELDAASGRVIALAGPEAHRYLTRRLGGGVVESEMLTRDGQGGEERPLRSRVLAQPAP